VVRRAAVTLHRPEVEQGLGLGLGLGSESRPLLMRARMMPLVLALQLHCAATRKGVSQSAVTDAAAATGDSSLQRTKSSDSLDRALSIIS
jgi:hypothetical protein